MCMSRQEVEERHYHHCIIIGNLSFVERLSSFGGNKCKCPLQRGCPLLEVTNALPLSVCDQRSCPFSEVTNALPLVLSREAVLNNALWGIITSLSFIRRSTVRIQLWYIVYMRLHCTMHGIIMTLCSSKFNVFSVRRDRWGRGREKEGTRHVISVPRRGRWVGGIPADKPRPASIPPAGHHLQQAVFTKVLQED